MGGDFGEFVTQVPGIVLSILLAYAAITFMGKAMKFMDKM